MNNIERRLVLYIKNILLLCTLFLSSVVNAAVVEITALYQPDISDTSHVSFKNTTANSGYCQQAPSFCGNNIFSVLIPDLTVYKHLISGTGSVPEDIIALKLDAKFRKVILTNTNSSAQAEAFFRINTASYELRRVIGGQGIVGGWIYPYVRGGCRKTIANSGDPVWYRIAWSFKESDTYCYQILNGSYDSDFRFTSISIGYELEVASPLGLSQGVYVGETTYSLGKGADFDYFTDDSNYTDNEIRFRITATVEHAFHMQFPAGSKRIQLEPSGGWGQWLNSGRMPAKMERNVDFSLTTSGPISIALQCEQEMGTNCALRNQNTGEKVELETRVTLPGLKPLGGGAEVRDYRLATGPIKQFFIPEAYSYKRQSTVHFRVNQPHVETMLKQPGSQWAGNVTLMFEAGL